MAGLPGRRNRLCGEAIQWDHFVGLTHSILDLRAVPVERSRISSSAQSDRIQAAVERESRQILSAFKITSQTLFLSLKRFETGELTGKQYPSNLQDVLSQSRQLVRDEQRTFPTAVRCDALAGSCTCTLFT